jgi:hypothetical protein
MKHSFVSSTSQNLSEQLFHHPIQTSNDESELFYVALPLYTILAKIWQGGQFANATQESPTK